MLWSDRRIHDRGASIVHPFDPNLVQPASIDVTLDCEFYSHTGTGVVRPNENNDEMFNYISIPKGGVYELRPFGFALASTYERVVLPSDVASRYEGKSSLGRIGLFTHVTAGFIDPGFEGHITLELFNATSSTIWLTPGMRIGQLCFIVMTETTHKPYGIDGVGSHYQGQRGPTLSRGYQKFSVKDVYE